MARTAREISQSIRTQLKVLDPSISAEPLTPERKIIDTVSEVIAEATFDDWLLNYQFDIDTKVGSDLDKFVALFGFSRQRARRSVGFVTFSRGTPAERDILIAAGTQVIKPATNVSSTVIFMTTVSVILPAGTTSVEAPIEAAQEGILSNVPAGTITSLGSGVLNDISEVTNENATTGGTEAETDAELRVRFKNTIFRNVAGTQDQYLALAIASRYANKANVIGPVSRFSEYVQIATGAATSQIPYSKYTYNFDYYLTNGDPDAELFYAPAGVDYTFGAAVPPTVTVNNATTLPNGTVALLEHTYCSANSRNDPANNIHNYIDVFVSGQNIQSVIESVRYPTNANNFNTTGGSPFNRANFLREGTSTQPAAGNRFQQLLWQPVAGIPSAIIIGSTTYVLGTHYWLVRDTTVYKGSTRARNGIEWASFVSIPDHTDFVLDYTFDKLPLQLNELMSEHKQIATDVLVHSATERYFKVHLVIMYTPGYDSSAVETAMFTALARFLERQNFGVTVQISDLIDVIHDVPGVDNVRLALAADGAAYGVQEVGSDGVTTIGTPKIADFAIQDSDLPVLQSIVTYRRSQNTWS